MSFLFGNEKKVRPREKFIVIMERILSVDSDGNISLRNRMKMKSFFRNLLILRVNRKWMTERLHSFSRQELVKMKGTIHTVILSCMSLFNDKTMEIRRNVWIFLSIIVCHMLQLDSNYPIKNLQYFLPLSLQNFLTGLRSALFAVSLDEQNEEVIIEAISCLTTIFSSFSSNFARNPLVEIFLQEKDEKTPKLEAEHDFFPKLSRYVQIFQSGWTIYRNSNSIILQFLNILNVQQKTYERLITPIFLRSDPILRNIRFRYHVRFQSFYEESTKKIMAQVKSGQEGYFSMFLRYYNRNNDDEKDINYDQILSYIISFINIFCTHPKYLSFCLTVVDTSEQPGKGGLVIEDSDGKSVSIRGTLLGELLSLMSLLTSLKGHPSRKEENDVYKPIMTESILNLLFLIANQIKQNGLKKMRKRRKEEDGGEQEEMSVNHTMSLFREDLRKNSLVEETVNDLNNLNLVGRICSHIIIHHSRKFGQSENFVFALHLLQYLFDTISEVYGTDGNYPSEYSKNQHCRLKIDYLRLWEILVGRCSTKSVRKKASISNIHSHVQLKKSELLIISILENCVVHGNRFLHKTHRISLIYELIRREEDVGCVFRENSEILSRIGKYSSSRVEEDHSLYTWKRFIEKEMIPKIEEWTRKEGVKVVRRKEKSEDLSMNKLIWNLQQCSNRMLSACFKK